MMWEGSYLFFAQSVEGGKLTETGSREEWKRLCEDKKTPRDNKDPRVA